MLHPVRALVLGVSLLAPPALAQQRDASTATTAEQLFQEGSQLLKAGQTDAACAKLSASQDQEPAIGTLGLLAYCHEQQGRLATALREYQAAAGLARSAGQATREQVARARVEQLEKRVAHVVIVFADAPADAQVFLGEHELTRAELGTPLSSDSGDIEVRALARAHQPYSSTVSVPSDGSTLRIVVPTLTRVRVSEQPATAGTPAPTSAPAAAKTKVRTVPHESSAGRVAMWSGLAVGAAGVALGSYSGLLALASNRASGPHCQGNTCDSQGVQDRSRALDQARLSTASFGAALLGLGASTYFFLSNRQPKETPSATLVATPDSCALAYQRTF